MPGCTTPGSAASNCSRAPAGLSSARDVRLYDEDTGLLLYVRRGPRAYVEAKLFTFDCHDAAQSISAAPFASAFHMSYPDAQQIPHETRKACIDLRFTTSLFIGGPVQSDPSSRFSATRASGDGGPGDLLPISFS